MFHPIAGQQLVGKHMKKYLLLSSLALSAMLPTAMAIAADLDLPPPPPPVEELRPATYDWSGAYIGAWAGLACLDGRGSLIDNTTPSGPWDNGGCGLKGGGLAGYNFQMDNIVFGAEADLGMSGDLVRNNTAGADFSFKMNYLATVRGRLGYAMDDTLLYVTAGGAYAQGELNGIISATPKNLKADQFGWTVGAGLEHAVTDEFRIRLEYMYTQFPTTKYTSCTTACNVDWNWGGEHEIKAAAIWAF